MRLRIRILLLSFLLSFATLGSPAPSFSEVIAVSDIPFHSAETKEDYVDADRVKLQLCECEPATGEPGGLSCAKEGFVISSFERQGQWVAGGGAVPLSRAICCRPCLPNPEDLPLLQVQDLHASKPLAIVSLGCHASTDSLGVRCEAQGGSFVTGFTDAVRVFTAVETLYPINSAQCCTPALLMDNGDAWELERCGCHASDDPSYPVNCGGNATHDALSGFDSFRVSPIGQLVPIGPATCCGVCVSRSIHPAADCADLDHCSGKGVCLLGRCECLSGWGGSDCSQPLGGGRFGGRVPPWAIALIVIGSCVLAIALLSVSAQIAGALMESQRDRNADSDDDEENGLRRRLLLRIDPDDTGSVGSQDTECDAHDIEEVEERIDSVVRRVDGTPETAEAEEEVSHGNENTEGPRGEQRAAGREEELVPESDPVPARNVAAAVTTTTDGDAAPAKSALLESFAGVGPLSTIDCIVCMIRPVQTVIVPCGHVCMCRRCSRRLQRCPMCRKDILRRQRLYV